MEPLEQIPSFLSSRKSFSAESHRNGPQGSGTNGKPPESGGPLPKIIVGSVALGAAFFAAYSTGYLDKYLNKEPHETLNFDKIASIIKDAQVLPENSKSSHPNDHAREPVGTPSDEKPANVEHAEHKSESLPDPNFNNDSNITEENQFQAKDTQELKEIGIDQHTQEQAPSSTESSSESNETNTASDKLHSTESSSESDETNTASDKLSEDSLGQMASEVKLDREQKTAAEVAPPLTQDYGVPSGNGTTSVPMPEVTSQDSPKVQVDCPEELKSASFLKLYSDFNWIPFPFEQCFAGLSRQRNTAT